MEWLLIFLLMAIVLVCYLLFAPFYFEINTITGLYGMRFHHLASAKLITSDRSLLIDLWIAGWTKQIDLFAKKAPGKEKSNQPAKKKKHFKVPFNKVTAVLKSFKVTKCYLDMDFGNVALNGKLYPCFYWLSSYTNKHLAINFLNKNEIVLEIENSIARIIWALIFHLFTFKKQKSWTTLMNYSAN